MARSGRVRQDVVADVWRHLRVRDQRPRPARAAVQNGWGQLQVQVKDDEAVIYLYDEIGFWGVTAADFVEQLAGIDASSITLHLNSPGGDVFDGVAIYNALRDHPADVAVRVDGLAASAASFIAQAGDKVTMNRGSQLMIHDAWGLCIGPAADMRETAALLDRVSDTIAGLYAARAGGTVEDWREAMLAESWYSAEEAVEANLADEVVPAKGDSDQDDDTGDSGDGDSAAEDKAPAAPQARQLASAHMFTGRATAPTPYIPSRQSPPDALAPAAVAALEGAFR